MQVPTLKPLNILEAMKSDQRVGKLEDGNDSLDNFIRQAVAKEPVVPFPRAVESPVQWIQLFQALDYQDLPGWPLLAPPKVEMQKCDKCGREFCSLVNYRRHIRVHRRALKLDKDFPKNRIFLGIFWDKLSLEYSMDIVSLGNISLGDVSGSSIVKGLTSLIRKPVFYSLPQAYVRAGSAILDVVQARPSRFPIASQELFDILDDASEKTFLCAGTALSMQKFVVDGEAAKIVLELKNIVACTCFLLEQKLVNAWLADKDVEAFRCQNLLMEEEEAEQKRQAEVLEKKRLKKLRQKEQQRVNEQINRDDENLSDSLYIAPSVEISNVVSTETSSPIATSVVPSGDLEASLDLKTSIDIDDNNLELCDGQLDRVPCSNELDHRNRKGNNHWQQTISRTLAPVPKQGVHDDQKSTSLTNGHMIWTRKTRPDTREEDLKIVLEESSDQLDSRRNFEDQQDRNENHELLIGSIPVTLGGSNHHRQSAILTSLLDDKQLGHVTSRPVKQWRPVGKHGVTNTSTIGKDGEMWRVMNNRDGERNKTTKNSEKLDSLVLAGEMVDATGGMKLFCSKTAEAFLTQRWNDAIAAEHVRLVLTSTNHHDDLEVGAVDECLNPNILCENRLPPKIKSKTRSEKNGKLKYIPKEKTTLDQVL